MVGSMKSMKLCGLDEIWNSVCRVHAEMDKLRTFFCVIKWAASSESIPLNMRRFRSYCACAKYHPGICSSFKPCDTL